MNQDLAKLTKERTNHRESCRRNDDHSHETIQNLYSAPARFIYELLQNADDTKASKVNFKLTSNQLEISHNGQPFDFKDVNSITTINFSTKKDEVNKIGTFGIGFKSVFAVTERPQIHSGEFHFAIEELIVPKEIEPLEDGVDDTTTIILPFKTTKSFYEKVLEYLQSLESESLLFLRNVQKIQWETESDNGCYFLKINKNQMGVIF